MGISMKTTSGKVLASVALLGTAAAIAGLGTYGAFTSTTEANQSVTAGSVKIDLGTGQSNTLTTAVTDMLPGDSVAKFVTLTNSGSSALNNVTLTTTATEPSTLTTNTVTGLMLKIDRCPEPWVAGTNTGTFVCSGVTDTVILSEKAIITAGQVLNGLSSLSAGATDYLKITTSFPSAAVQPDFPGSPKSTIKFSFTATQRTAVTQ